MILGVPDSTDPTESFEEALERYSQERDKNPLDLGVHIKIADLYLMNGRKEKALEEYEGAIKVFKKNALTQLVIATYQQVFTIFPDHFKAYREVADFYLENRFQEDAISVLLALTRRYQANDMGREMSEVMAEITSIAPDNVAVKQKLAAIYEENLLIKQGKKKAAEQDLPQAEQRPVKQDLIVEDIEAMESDLKKEPSIQLPKAEDLKESQPESGPSIRLPKAEEPKESQPEKEPLIRLPEAEEPNKPEPESEPPLQLSEVEEQIKAELKSEPPAAVPGQEEKTDLLDLTGAESDLDKVQEEIQSLIEKDFSEPPEVHYQRGVEFQSAKKYTEAMNSFLTVLGSMGKRADCYARLAECCLALHKDSTAEKFITEGLSLTSLSQNEKLDLKLLLARILKAQGQGVQAQKVIDEVYQVDKNFKRR